MEGHKAPMKRIFQNLEKKYPPVVLPVYTIEDVIKHKPASQRKRYRRAYERLKLHGLKDKHVKIKMFVKHERMSYPGNDVTEYYLKPPRAIQARSQEFNLIAQKYFLPYAKHFKNMRHHDGRTPFAKGLDPQEIAEQLFDDWCHFNNPVALLIDHNRWDSCLNTDWLKSTHQYYNKFFRCAEFMRLLKCQLLNKCTTSTQVKYTVEGTRMSGDPDTSDGNSTDNLALICDLFRGVEMRETIMGDDSVIIFDLVDVDIIRSRMDEHVVHKVYPWTTVYRFVVEFEQVEFCQCKPILTINGYIMVRDISRVITRGFTCISQNVVKTPRLFYDWMRAVGDCEWSVNPGVPVHTAVAEYMRSFSDRPLKEPQDRSRFKVMHKKLDHTITMQARLSYQVAFGISVQTQLEIEKWFKDHQGKATNRYVSIFHPYPGHCTKYLDNLYE